MRDIGKPFGLPPLVGGFADGSVTWQQLQDVDYETLGYFLSCHLIIEHYLDEYLKIAYPELDWEAARHTFNQKVSLLSRFKISDKYDCIPSIRHLNSLRNKLSHNIQFKIKTEDLIPLADYLSKIYSTKAEVPKEPKEILGHYTSMTCVLFAGMISRLVHASPRQSKRGS
jgi:hypothetical protein